MCEYRLQPLELVMTMGLSKNRLTMSYPKNQFLITLLFSCVFNENCK
jgi:hypothetical protein